MSLDSVGSLRTGKDLFIAYEDINQLDHCKLVIRATLLLTLGSCSAAVGLVKQVPPLLRLQLLPQL